ncbi:MAG TPA: hypothetical protein P5134_00555 [Bacteroidales bacterium]|nr:hypothetical protein [Bacteroidales bacterium]
MKEKNNSGVIYHARTIGAFFLLAFLAYGFLLELFGKEWSIYFLGLGGLWEVVFAIWLIIRGSKNVKIISEHEM